MISALLGGCVAAAAAPKKPVKAAPKKPATPAATPLVALDKVVWHEGLVGELGWSFAIKLRDPKRPLTDHQGAYQAFERYLVAPGAPSAPHQAEKARLRTLRPQVAKLFGEALTRVGEAPLQFFPTDNLSPVRLAQLPDGPALLAGWIVLPDVLDTRETTALNRASLIAQKTALPILRRMHLTLKAANVRYLGCVVTYGSKDFTDESPTTVSLKGEVLALVVSQAELRKLAAGQETENVLLNQSLAYLRERGTSDMKQVALLP